MQDCIVSLDVMDQIQQFWLELKGENLLFQTMQKSLKNIDVKQFYSEIEWTYLNFDLDLILFRMDILSIFGRLYKVQQERKSKNIKPKIQKDVL